MRIDVITLFPEILSGPLDASIMGRARRAGQAEIALHQLRDYATDKHHTVDDKPYGGGPGMLLKCEPIFAAVQDYEGVDERVREHLVEEELSIGDFILTNGALSALVVIDAVVRLLPNVVGNEASTQSESFSAGRPCLEGPQYTRPEEFGGWRVPEILLSGNHGHIEKWNAEQSLRLTERMRPDLLKVMEDDPAAERNHRA
jgi:tRNA (guanine37-N1)-methyltransferase